MSISAKEQQEKDKDMPVHFVCETHGIGASDKVTDTLDDRVTLKKLRKIMARKQEIASAS